MSSSTWPNALAAPYGSSVVRTSRICVCFSTEWVYDVTGGAGVGGAGGVAEPVVQRELGVLVADGEGVDLESAAVGVADQGGGLAELAGGVHGDDAGGGGVSFDERRGPRGISLRDT
jgi:hypothetical protein